MLTLLNRGVFLSTFLLFTFIVFIPFRRFHFAWVISYLYIATILLKIVNGRTFFCFLFFLFFKILFRFFNYINASLNVWLRKTLCCSLNVMSYVRFTSFCCVETVASRGYFVGTCHRDGFCDKFIYVRTLRTSSPEGRLAQSDLSIRFAVAAPRKKQEGWAVPSQKMWGASRLCITFKMTPLQVTHFGQNLIFSLLFFYLFASRTHDITIFA